MIIFMGVVVYSVACKHDLECNVNERCLCCKAEWCVHKWICRRYIKLIIFYIYVMRYALQDDQFMWLSLWSSNVEKAE